MAAASLLCALAMACAGCAGPVGTPRPSVTALFHDGIWLLTVNRTLRDEARCADLPERRFSESDYHPCTMGVTYRLEAVDHGRRVVVAEPAMVAVLRETTMEELTYEFLEGAFAGGRLVVSRDRSRLQGEVTIYGSGVPVVGSDRGQLREGR